MWNAFSTLAQKNLDHHNNHPVAHAVMTAGAALVAVVAVGFAANKVNEEPVIPAGSMKQ